MKKDNKQKQESKGPSVVRKQESKGPSVVAMGMAPVDGKGEVLVAGVDLGDKDSHYCVIRGSTGEVVEEGRMRTREEEIRAWVGERARMRVAMEVGTHSGWISRLLEGLGQEVLVANARKVRLIYANPRKNDRVDAQTLARLARLDPTLLAPIRHRSAEAQSHLSILRARDGVVAARTQLICTVRSLVKGTGQRLPRCSAESFSKVQEIPSSVSEAIRPLLTQIRSLTRTIQRYDKMVDYLARTQYPVTQHLQQISGVGPLTSLAYILTLWDADRFTKSRQVGPFLGLTARQDQSSDSNPQLGITKAGDEYLRRLLVSSAHYILGPLNKQDSDLRRWGLRLCQRGGKNAKKRAVVAVARKLAVLLHHLWVTGEVYEPLRQPTVQTSVA